jgi:large conductance mechanosensitive channel
MGLVKEFKEFAVKGNVLDLAIGVIIGGAFGKIVASVVDDILMPPIGMAMGKVDFKNLKIVLQEADVANKVTEVAIRYGNFIQSLIDFTIISLCIFALIKGINKMKKEEEAAPAPAPAGPTNEEVLLTEIRDLLRSR